MDLRYFSFQKAKVNAMFKVGNQVACYLFLNGASTPTFIEGNISTLYENDCVIKDNETGVEFKVEFEKLVLTGY
jgi:hypothetical protein